MRDFLEAKQTVLKILAGYEKVFGAGAVGVEAFRVMAGRFENLTHRSNLAGHVTGSAIVLNLETRRVFRIYNPKVGAWCYSGGGHIEIGETPWNAAQRELKEETGIDARFVAVGASDAFVPVLISVQPIRASVKKNEPAHWHYDMIYLFEVDHEPELHLDLSEVQQHRWAPLSELCPPDEAPVVFEEQLEIYRKAAHGA